MLEDPLKGSRSARTYAANWGAPAILGGYNWCHLVGHGGGGSDQADNLVAASTHCNSEQLAIESVLYQFRLSGVGVRVVAFLYDDAEHLAPEFVYNIVAGGRTIYVRHIDGFRKDKPSFSELGAVRKEVTRAISQALRRPVAQ